jgi:Ser/Thr protein kinase RdoA (MazF antagonist)
VGDTVRRRADAWTPAVHALLHHLEGVGFEAPRVLGMDEQGREVLAFMEGEAHSGPLESLPTHVTADEHLVGAADLLRRYHDIVSGFRPPPGARWRLVAPAPRVPHEVICHNDWAPWNALFRHGRLAAMLDWDLAGPGTRLWDVAHAVYFWAPLFSEQTPAAIGEKARRVRLFLDAYGAYGLEARRGLLPTLRLRLEHTARFVEEQARRGDPGMQRLASWGVPKKLREDDIQYLDDHHAELERAL